MRISLGECEIAWQKDKPASRKSGEREREKKVLPEMQDPTLAEFMRINFQGVERHCSIACKLAGQIFMVKPARLAFFAQVGGALTASVFGAT